MSFILDALQKSETERRRATSPALAGMAVEPPRPAVPLWVWTVIGLLVVAVLGLGAAWWTSAGPPAESGLEAAAGGATGAGVAAAPSTTAAELAAAAPATETETQRETDGANAAAPAAATGGFERTAAGRSGSAAASGERPAVTTGDGRNAVPLTTAVAGAGAEAPRLPDEAAAPAPASSRAVLPTMAELLAAGVELPQLRLELHVYHATPSSRWVYINGGRYTEGQLTAAGPRLVEILPEGVALSHQGRDFLLLAQ